MKSKGYKKKLCFSVVITLTSTRPIPDNLKLIKQFVNPPEYTSLREMSENFQLKHLSGGCAIFSTFGSSLGAEDKDSRTPRVYPSHN